MRDVKLAGTVYALQIIVRVDNHPLYLPVNLIEVALEYRGTNNEAGVVIIMERCPTRHVLLTQVTREKKGK